MTVPTPGVTINLFSQRGAADSGKIDGVILPVCLPVVGALQPNTVDPENYAHLEVTYKSASVAEDATAAAINRLQTVHPMNGLEWLIPMRLTSKTSLFSYFGFTTLPREWVEESPLTGLSGIADKYGTLPLLALPPGLTSIPINIKDDGGDKFTYSTDKMSGANVPREAQYTTAEAVNSVVGLAAYQNNIDVIRRIAPNAQIWIIPVPRVTDGTDRATAPPAWVETFKRLSRHRDIPLSVMINPYQDSRAAIKPPADNLPNDELAALNATISTNRLLNQQFLDSFATYFIKPGHGHLLYLNGGAMNSLLATSDGKTYQAQPWNHNETLYFPVKVALEQAKGVGDYLKAANFQGLAAMWYGWTLAPENPTLTAARNQWLLNSPDDEDNPKPEDWAGLTEADRMYDYTQFIPLSTYAAAATIHLNQTRPGYFPPASGEVYIDPPMLPFQLREDQANQLMGHRTDSQSFLNFGWYTQDGWLLWNDRTLDQSPGFRKINSRVVMSVLRNRIALAMGRLQFLPSSGPQDSIFSRQMLGIVTQILDDLRAEGGIIAYRLDGPETNADGHPHLIIYVQVVGSASEIDVDIYNVEEVNAL